MWLLFFGYFVIEWCLFICLFSDDTGTLDHLHAVLGQLLHGGERNQRVGDQCINFLQRTANAAAGDAKLGVVGDHDDMRAFVNHQMLEFRDFNGILGGAVVRQKTVAGENGVVDAIERGQKLFGKKAHAGQRFTLDKTADVIHGKALAKRHLGGDAQRVGENSQILDLF